MSMPRLAILTPDPADPHYAHRWKDAYETYRAAFAAAGVEAVAAPWVDPWPADVAAALPVRAWGYHKRIDAWRAALAAAPVRTINLVETLRWNTDKRYLAELAEAGIPIVATHFVETVDAAALDAAFDAFGADRLVVKPVISAGAWFTEVVERGGAVPPFARHSMIQPFLPAVQGEGELSLFYFGGALSHAVRKVAADGDFRVQPQHGGRLALFKPDAEMLDVAERVLAAAPGPLTYARVDLIRGLDGRLELMELEAIEPDLYFDLDAGAAGRFVAAVLGAL
jgi:glutathione synthase/RimK-type ligase-like ATP-grasp enzyme